MISTLKRAFKKFQNDEMTDSAAALTYYMMMSLFPALLVGVSLLGLLGDKSLVTHAVDYARDNGAPAEVTDALQALLTKTVEATGSAVSGALVLGLAVALYGASGAFGAAGRALNRIYGTDETRNFFAHKLADIGFTILVIALALVALVSIFLGGNLAGDLFGTIGLGDTAASIWKIARWPVAIGAVLADLLDHLRVRARHRGTATADRHPGRARRRRDLDRRLGRVLLLRLELRQVRRDVRRVRGRRDPAAVALPLEHRVPLRGRAQQHRRPPGGHGAAAHGRPQGQADQRPARRRLRARRARAGRGHRRPKLTRTRRRRHGAGDRAGDEADQDGAADPARGRSVRSSS